MNDNIFNLMAKEKGWSTELLYQLVASVKDYAIFVTDLDGTIVSWNVGAENLFGFPAAEAIGQNCRMLFTKEDQAKNEPEKEKETARREGRAEDERWHIRRDGSHFFASGLQTPLYDGSGKHTGYAKIARDLTERIKLRDDLQALKDNLEVQVRQRTSELTESNESLRSEVMERTESERIKTNLLRKIVKTQEDERKRIAREIHDHVGQQLTGLQLQLQFLLDKYEKDAEFTSEIRKVKIIADQMDSDVDFLAWELRPSVLDNLGLPTAMKKFVEDWSKQFGVPAEFNLIGLDGKHLMPEIEINLYRIAQEALNNTCKYAKANNAAVSLQRRDGTISLIIEDDGVGFIPTKKAVMTGDDRGLGLVGMKERAELVGGIIEIESSPGNGTTIYVRVPARFDEERK